MGKGGMDQKTKKLGKERRENPQYGDLKQEGGHD